MDSAARRAWPVPSKSHPSERNLHPAWGEWGLRESKSCVLRGRPAVEGAGETVLALARELRESHQPTWAEQAGRELPHRRESRRRASARLRGAGAGSLLKAWAGGPAVLAAGQAWPIRGSSARVLESARTVLETVCRASLRAASGLPWASAQESPERMGPKPRAAAQGERGLAQGRMAERRKTLPGRARRGR
jgi:hypothetical protein